MINYAMPFDTTFKNKSYLCRKIIQVWQKRKRKYRNRYRILLHRKRRRDKLRQDLSRRDIKKLEAVRKALQIR